MDDFPACSPAVQPVQAAFHRISRAMQRGATPEWVHLDLSIGPLKTLMVLASHPCMRVGEVAETMAVSKPTASILIDRLVQAGYAQRTEDPEDRRRTEVEPTAAGSELIARLRQGGGERLAHWLDRLDPEDLDALLRGLNALADIAEREAASNGAEATIRQ